MMRHDRGPETTGSQRGGPSNATRQISPQPRVITVAYAYELSRTRQRIVLKTYPTSAYHDEHVGRRCRQTRRTTLRIRPVRVDYPNTRTGTDKRLS